MAADLDALDLKILTHLLRDGRAPAQQVAEQSASRGPPSPTASHKLERDGVIRGHTVVVEPRRSAAPSPPSSPRAARQLDAKREEGLRRDAEDATRSSKRTPSPATTATSSKSAPTPSPRSTSSSRNSTAPPLSLATRTTIVMQTHCEKVGGITLGEEESNEARSRPRLRRLRRRLHRLGNDLSRHPHRRDDDAAVSAHRRALPLRRHRPLHHRQAARRRDSDEPPRARRRRPLRRADGGHRQPDRGLGRAVGAERIRRALRRHRAVLGDADRAAAPLRRAPRAARRDRHAHRLRRRGDAGHAARRRQRLRSPLRHRRASPSSSAASPGSTARCAASTRSRRCRR